MMVGRRLSDSATSSSSLNPVPILQMLCSSSREGRSTRCPPRHSMAWHILLAMLGTKQTLPAAS